MTLAPGHVEVRIRTSDEAESRGTFTTWPLGDLDRLVGIINRWGNPGDGHVTGQFTWDADAAWYFELVVQED